MLDVLLGGFGFELLSSHVTSSPASDATPYTDELKRNSSRPFALLTSVQLIVKCVKKSLTEEINYSY
jgi:hypothetical protein